MQSQETSATYKARLISCVRQCSKPAAYSTDFATSSSTCPIAKSSVTLLIFRGDECEDVHEFISNYKRAGRLNGWNKVNVALELPSYLKRA